MFGFENNGIVWVVLVLALICFCRGNGGCGGCR